MRSKANHLLTYVNDTNDVKEALNQWQASSASLGRPSNRASEAPLTAGLAWTDAGLHQSNGMGKAGSLINGRVRERNDGKYADLALTSAIQINLKRVNAALTDAPFEQRPAVLRSVEGMSTFTALDRALSRTDEHFEHTYLSPPRNRDATLRRRPLASFDVEPGMAGGMTAGASGDLLRTLESATSIGVLRSALTMGINDGEEQDMANGSGSNAVIVSNGHAASATATNEPPAKKAGVRPTRAIPYPLDMHDSLDGILGDQFQLGAWWNCMANPSLLASGIAPLSTSVQLDTRRIRLIGESSLRKKRKRREQWSFGGVGSLERNVSTITKLRNTHAKFGALISHIESEEPIPAALGVVSSDESDGEMVDKPRTDGHQGRRGRRRPREVDLSSPSMHDPHRNPYPKLASEGATELLEDKTQFLLAHVGFEGSQRAAANVLADVASEYIMNLGRTLRLYSDQFAHEMSVEEIILHALFENGGMDVRNMESYVVDDVIRYGIKMSDLLRKLQSSYKETLNNANVTMEDEAYFAENAQGSNDQIMSGGCAQDMGDDFFGFKEMGLDKELGIDMSQLVVPSKLFHRSAATAAAATATGAAGVGAVHGGQGPARLSAVGPGQRGAVLGGGPGAKGAVPLGGDVVLFEPPPEYVPLSEASLSAQIGLLQPFYRELLRARGQWQHKNPRRHGIHDGQGQGLDGGGDANDEEGEGGDDNDNDAADQDEREGEDKRRAQLILPDEEVERSRYKVPPNGKMPKRAMKVRGSDRTRPIAALPQAAPATAPPTAGEKPKTGSSKKKKKETS